VHQAVKQLLTLSLPARTLIHCATTNCQVGCSRLKMVMLAYQVTCRDW